jgi:hypothetical protein
VGKAHRGTSSCARLSRGQGKLGQKHACRYDEFQQETSLFESKMLRECRMCVSHKPRAGLHKSLS